MNESTMWYALGWTMLHSLWGGLALGVIVALGRLALWRARPAVRYGFLCVALVMLAALPVVLFAFAPGTVVQSGSGQSVSLELGAAPTESWTRALIPWLPWVWTLGSSLYLVLLLRGLAGTSLLRRRACAALERVELSAHCRSLARDLGVARRVLVRVCDEVASPLVVGIARPLIVLPVAIFARCTPEQIEMVLLHELAHVRRWDNLVQLAQRVVQAVLFYQPAVWLVSSWIDLEREHCCDAVVLDRTQRPRVYARTLLALADSQGGAPALALSMAKRPLLARIERILRTQEPTGMQAKTTAFILTTAFLIGGATLTPLTKANAGTQHGVHAQLEAPRAPHPFRLPADTDCAACHHGPIVSRSTRVPHEFEVHADIPASTVCSDCHMSSSSLAPTAAPLDDLDRLRVQERELQRLLGEVERLRRELEALRTGAAMPSQQRTRLGLSTIAPRAKVEWPERVRRPALPRTAPSSPIPPIHAWPRAAKGAPAPNVRTPVPIDRRTLPPRLSVPPAESQPRLPRFPEAPRSPRR